MDIRPPVAVKAGRASSAQIRHRPRPAVRPAPMTAEAAPAASRVSLLPEAPKAWPQSGRTVSVAAASPEPKANSRGTSEPLGSAGQGVVAGLQSSSSSNPDFLVAIVMAGPDIKSVSDLKGRTVAIDDRYSTSGSTVRTAIVAAGAPQVQLSEGQGTAMNRLSNGEVPAAVVALVTPDVADKFPAFAGYRMFQVPLSPYSLKARP
jgi:ABC transporter, phosphonate, periplasmic substrate-binding protein